MSRKDYIAIGSVLRGEFAIATENLVKLSVWRMTLSIADKFAQDNDRFDRAKFYEFVFGDSDNLAVRDRIHDDIHQEIREEIKG